MTGPILLRVHCYSVYPGSLPAAEVIRLAQPQAERMVVISLVLEARVTRVAPKTQAERLRWEAQRTQMVRQAKSAQVDWYQTAAPRISLAAAVPRAARSGLVALPIRLAPKAPAAAAPVESGRRVGLLQ